MSYDENNIFAKILKGDIPCKRIYEDEYVLSFYDINPQKKIHVLIELEKRKKQSGLEEKKNRK